jgi:hypothetical protein
VTPSPIQVALQVADACEACGLLYLVGGSIASSLGGEPRTTLDVDMVVDMTEPDIDGFLAPLGSGFYADEEAIRRAIRQRSSVKSHPPGVSDQGGRKWSGRLDSNQRPPALKASTARFPAIFCTFRFAC